MQKEKPVTMDVLKKGATLIHAHKSLVRNRGNVAVSAAELGISPRTLWRLIEKHPEMLEGTGHHENPGLFAHTKKKRAAKAAKAAKAKTDVVKNPAKGWLRSLLSASKRLSREENAEQDDTATEFGEMPWRTKKNDET